MEKLGKEIEACRRLLSSLEQITKEDKEFLTAEYSSKIQSQSLLNQVIQN